MDFLEKLNKVLKAINVPIQITSCEDCLSALWIPLVEGVLDIRLEEIQRSPVSDAERVENLNFLLKFLERALRVSLSHISAESLLQKEPMAVKHLTEIVYDLAEAASILKSTSSDTVPDSYFLVSEPILESRVPKVTPNAVKSDQFDETRHLSSRKTPEQRRARVLPAKGRQATGSDEKFQQKADVRKPSSVQRRRSARLASQQVKKPNRAAAKNGINTTRKALGKEVLLEALRQERRELAQELRTLVQKVERDARESERKLDAIQAISGIKINAAIKKDSIFSSLKATPTPPVSKASISSEKDPLLAAVLRDMQNALGLPYEVSERLYNRAARGQVDMTRRDLAERTWYHRVEAQKAAKENDEALKKIDDLQALRRLELSKPKGEGGRVVAQRQYRERVGAVIRLEKRRKELEEEVEGYFKKRWLKEERLLEEMVQTFVNTQRSLLLEERRLEREMDKEAHQKSSREKEAKLFYMKDQISMLKEALAEKKKEMEVGRQAQRQAVKGALVEEKQRTKRELQLLKEKLQTDADENHFVELEKGLAKDLLERKGL